MYFGQQEWQGLAMLTAELAMECLKGRPWGFVPSCLRSLQISCSQSFQNWWSSPFRWDVKMACRKNNQFPQWSLSLPLNIQGYQCTCLCFHEWPWLMCFTAATNPLPMLCAGMMDWKGLVCIVLHMTGCWQCRDVTDQLWFTASAGSSGFLSHCKCDSGKELGK